MAEPQREMKEGDEVWVVDGCYWDDGGCQIRKLPIDKVLLAINGTKVFLFNDFVFEGNHRSLLQSDVFWTLEEAVGEQRERLWKFFEFEMNKIDEEYERKKMIAEIRGEA